MKNVIRKQRNMKRIFNLVLIMCAAWTVKAQTVIDPRYFRSKSHLATNR